MVVVVVVGNKLVLHTSSSASGGLVMLLVVVGTERVFCSPLWESWTVAAAAKEEGAPVRSITWRLSLTHSPTLHVA